MMCLILNSDQVNEVRGFYGDDQFELNPISLENGFEWILSTRVLNRPEFASVNDILLSLPQREVDPNEFLNHDIL